MYIYVYIRSSWIFSNFKYVGRFDFLAVQRLKPIPRLLSLQFLLNCLEMAMEREREGTMTVTNIIFRPAWKHQLVNTIYTIDITLEV